MAITRIPKHIPILVAGNANGVGTSALVNDYKNILLDLSTSGNADMTLKIQASLQPPNDPPNFGTAASTTNRWFYIAIYDLNDPSSVITGSTGVSFGGTDSVDGGLVNTDGIVWLNVEVSNYVAGSLNVTAVAYNNM